MMNKIIKSKFNRIDIMFSFIFAFMSIFLFCQPVWAVSKEVIPNFKPGEDYVAGQLLALSIDGPCFYCPPTEEKWHKIEPGMSFSDGYSIRTGENGYLVMSWSENNMIFIKPLSGLRIKQNVGMKGKIELELHYCSVMVSARDSAGLVSLVGRNIKASVVHGEMVFIGDKNSETVKAVSGNLNYKLSGDMDNSFLNEQECIEIDAKDSKPIKRKFDVNTELHSFRRFHSWLDRFEDFHKSHSTEFKFKLNEIMVNNQYFNSMRNENGKYVLETPDGKIPRSILFQAKINPYPSEMQRIELNLGHELIYVFREGRNGYHEVNFDIPSIPEFNVVIHFVDSLDRRIPIFRAGFTVQNKRRSELLARDFCKDLCKAISRHDSIWLRTHISDKYRDNTGNDRFNFIKSTENAFKEYRDIRLFLTPFKFEFVDGKIKIRVNYRISALTSNWKYRYERNGTELLTIIPEDGIYKLVSKTDGLYFNLLRVTCDLRRAVLKGRIVDNISGFPIEGVDVTLVGTSYHTVSNSMGEYVIHNIPPGNYNLKYSKNGYGVISASNVTLTPYALSR